MTIGNRDPGYLPNVLARIEKVRQLLSSADLDEKTREVIEGILALATTQHELNKRLWEGKKGFPEPHSDTHSPCSEEDPLPTAEPVPDGEVASAGDGCSFVRDDHVHETRSLVDGDLVYRIFFHTRVMIRVSLGF